MLKESLGKYTELEALFLENLPAAMAAAAASALATAAPTGPTATATATTTALTPAQIAASNKAKLEKFGANDEGDDKYDNDNDPPRLLTC